MATNTANALNYLKEFLLGSPPPPAPEPTLGPVASFLNKTGVGFFRTLPVGACERVVAAARPDCDCTAILCQNRDFTVFDIVWLIVLIATTLMLVLTCISPEVPAENGERKSGEKAVLKAQKEGTLADVLTAIYNTVSDKASTFVEYLGVKETKVADKVEKKAEKKVEKKAKKGKKGKVAMVDLKKEKKQKTYAEVAKKTISEKKVKQEMLADKIVEQEATTENKIEQEATFEDAVEETEQAGDEGEKDWVKC